MKSRKLVTSWLVRGEGRRRYELISSPYYKKSYKPLDSAVQEIMSSGDLSESRKHLLTPPDPQDRVKRLRTTQEHYHPLLTDSSEENENAFTDPAPQQARKSIAKTFCCYDLGAPVRLEIRSAWEFRFEGTHALLLVTLNNLSILERSLSKQTRFYEMNGSRRKKITGENL